MGPASSTPAVAISDDGEVIEHARTYIVETLCERYLIDGGTVTRYAKRPQWAAPVDGLALRLSGRPVATVGDRAEVPVAMPDGALVIRRGSVVVGVRAVAL